MKKNEQAGMAMTSDMVGLICAIEADFNQHLMPYLPAEQKYPAAMMRRALAILRQKITGADISEQLVHQQTGYENSAELAQAIRARHTQIDDRQLASALKAYVRARLAVTNPAFLSRHEGQEDISTESLSDA